MTRTFKEMLNADPATFFDPQNPPLDIFKPHTRTAAGKVEYYQFICSVCGDVDNNTFTAQVRDDMIRHQLCFQCNFWRDHVVRNHDEAHRLTVIEGVIYAPGNCTSGPYRGMSGRRFDIEYLSNSEYAGKKITTFDLWSGGAMPDYVREFLPDTAKFLGGAYHGYTHGTGFFQNSDGNIPPYPLPKDIGIKA